MPFVGMIGLACVLFLDLALFLVMPWWVVALLVVAWGVLFAIACRWWTAYPGRMLWPAVAGVVMWVLAVGVGAVVS